MKDFAQIIIIGVIIAVAAQFLVYPYKVSGESMVPTYRHNQWLLIDKVSYKFRDPKENEIVVFRFEQTELVKRVIKVTPEGKYWVEGDNKEASTDSREFGAIPKEVIVGKVIN